MKLLFLKLTLAPALVLLGTLAARRWGPRAGGFVAGFPNTAGPVLFLLALEQGAAFTAQAAVSAMLGVAALAFFNPAYVWTATRFGVALSLAAGWGAFIVVMLGFHASGWQPQWWQALACCWAALYACRRMLPRLKEPAKGPAPRAWDLPVRAGAAIALVLALTGAAHILGPSWSGLLTPFPVTSAVLAAFAHHEQGAGGSERMLKGIMLSLNSVGLFMAVAALTLERMGTLPAFGLALMAGGAMQVGLYFRTRK